MHFRVRAFCGSIIPVLLMPLASLGDDEVPGVDIDGLLFGDAYYNPSNHLESGDGALGLVLRRGYLTFDGTIPAPTFWRIRFELNQSGEFETYDFEVDFKDLYVGWKLGRQQLLLGLSPTPTFDLIESQWGLRYLMRTAVDLQGGPSRETGVSARGPLNQSGTLSYRAMVGTTVDFGAESSERARYMAALTWKPAPHWTLDFYVDRQIQPGPSDVTSAQVYLSRITDTWRWGMQYSYADRQTAPPLDLASAWAVKPVGERTSLIGRIDRVFEPSPKGNNIAYIPFDPTAPATLYLLAYEYRASPNFTLTPNAVVVDYDRNDEGVRPTTDVYLRLTAYFRF
jgi:hypothetical protein